MNKKLADLQEKAHDGQTEFVATKLVGYSPTRFGSALKMLERLHENANHIRSLWVDCPFTADEWKALPYLVKSLSPWGDAAEMLGGDKYVTLSKVSGVFHILLNIDKPGYVGGKAQFDEKAEIVAGDGGEGDEEKDDQRAPPPPPLATAFHEALVEHTKERLAPLLEDTSLVATVLDPRYCQLIDTPDWPHRERAVNALRANIKRMRDERIRLNPSRPGAAAGTPGSEKKLPLGARTPSPKKGRPSLMANFPKTPPKAIDPDLNELDRYLTRTHATEDEDPHEWWRETGSKLYPSLAAIAKQILCIPATSIPCERLFSSAGAVLSKRRARLRPQLAEGLVFLHENIDILNAATTDALQLPKAAAARAAASAAESHDTDE